MRRFKFRRNSFRRNVRRARPIIRAATGITLAKRMLLSGVTVPDVTAVDWDNPLKIQLLKCQESMDEEQEADGTSPAQVPLYSRLTGMRLNMQVVGPASSSVVHRWILHKKPDGEDLVSDATRMLTAWHSSDDTQAQREFRKFTVAKGILITNASTGVTPLRVFVKRAAMKRISPFRENDILQLDIAKDATGISSTIHGFGTLWVRANA